MKLPERIETERLVLRVPRMDDAPVIFDGWAQDKEVTRYLAWRPDQRIEQTQEFVRNCLCAWETEVENVTSRRVLEKVGMQCEGILRKYILHPNISDIPRDSYIYAITR